jgi:uncharacterized membrane protein
MNKPLIFLIIATSILVLSAIVICVSPIINNIEVRNYGWSPANWRNLNCQLFADEMKKDNIDLDKLQKYKKYKNICYRQKAMFGLENSAFVINIILAFICADLTLLHYLNVGKSFEKKTGLIGLISGIIGFILTLVYVCFSGYIFNNDVAYCSIVGLNFIKPGLTKLYPNGALYKFEASDSTGTNGNFIKVSDKEQGEYPSDLLFKDLGKKQYNYNTKYYQTYMKNDPSNVLGGKQNCHIISTYTPGTVKDSCDYLYYPPYTSTINKYIYDRWLTALILSVLIVACNVALSIFGFLLFKSSEESAPLSEQSPIIYKK